VKLDAATIDAHNKSILGYNHDDATRKSILEANGLADDGSVHPGAVALNNLDDWYEFHQSVLK
jgi:phage tail protein X